MLEKKFLRREPPFPLWRYPFANITSLLSFLRTQMIVSFGRSKPTFLDKGSLSGYPMDVEGATVPTVVEASLIAEGLYVRPSSISVRVVGPKSRKSPWSGLTTGRESGGESSGRDSSPSGLAISLVSALSLDLRLLAISLSPSTVYIKWIHSDYFFASGKGLSGAFGSGLGAGGSAALFASAADWRALRVASACISREIA